MGTVRVTTAASYRNAHCRGAVFIGQRDDNFLVFYVQAGEQDAHASCACTADHLPRVLGDMVDRYLLGR